jgi:hypothetical protein
MKQEVMTSLYEGLRDTVQNRCTILGMKKPQLIVDKDAGAKGFKVSRPMVDQVKVFIRMQGMWMVIDITVISEVIRSVIRVIREWCAKMFGDSELEAIPSFDDEAVRFA